ncbi:MAG: TrmH family RNA methyltransferase [Fluviicola sp.]
MTKGTIIPMTVDEKVLAAFYDIISESKQEIYDRIAADRTRHIVVVMENIRKDHNASAVMRTCDCFGIQDLHTIEKDVTYVVQREIAKGASTWIDLHSHSIGENPGLECIDGLKKQGYQIICTSPHTEQTLEDIDLQQPSALVFGTEIHGISRDILDVADQTIRLPMYGFTESFNVSVSAALSLHSLRNRLEKSNINWRLSHEDQIKLKIQWCTKIIRDGEAVEREIRRRIFEKE